MRLPSHPVFYDFEASRIFDGFPIEVGWAFVDADQRTICAEAHLIRPDSSWDIAERWDDDAQALHGISRDLLEAHGRPSHQVASHMNAALSGRTLFADSALDEKWLVDLFDVADLPPAFEVRRTSCEMLVQSFARSKRISSPIFDLLMKEAALQAPQNHRAKADAVHWAWIWRGIQAASAKCLDQSAIGETCSSEPAVLPPRS